MSRRLSVRLEPAITATTFGAGAAAACALAVTVVRGTAGVGIAWTLGVLVLAGGAIVRDKPVRVVLPAAAFVLAATADFPGYARFGGISGQAVTTSLLLFTFGLLVVTEFADISAGVRRPFIFGMAFLLYMVASNTWGTLSVAGAQNEMAYALLFVSYAVGSLIPESKGETHIELARVLAPAVAISGTLLACELVVGGISSGRIVGPRSWALFALVAFGCALGEVIGGRRRWLLPAAALLIGIALTLSRTAFATALILVVLAAASGKRGLRTSRLVLAVLSVAAVGFLSVSHFGPLRARFESGDVQNVTGGIAVNVTGRGELWHYTYIGIRKKPLWGHGVGSVEADVSREFNGKIVHPHNDYLRLLYDFGLFGASLWLASFLLIFRRAVTAWIRAPRNPIQFSAVAAMLSLSLAMLTDNAVVYSFFVVPVALIAGLAARDAEAHAP